MTEVLMEGNCGTCNMKVFLNSHFSEYEWEMRLLEAVKKFRSEFHVRIINNNHLLENNNPYCWWRKIPSQGLF